MAQPKSNEEIVEELLKEAKNDFDLAKASAGREVSFSYWFREEVTKALAQKDAELQKAREEERERIKQNLLLYKGTLCSRDREYNAQCSICTKTCRLILDCDEIEALIDHSELDQDKQ